MDHRYIDEHSVAQRYIDQALKPEERAEFEAHLVDCQECTDRLLLAGMFQEPRPLRARVAAKLKPWQLVVIFAIAALLLLAIPTVLLPLWQLFRR